MFNELEAKAPAILILDEVDALMSQNGEDDGGTSERVKGIMLERTSNLMKSDSDVMLVGATNRYINIFTLICL